MYRRGLFSAVALLTPRGATQALEHPRAAVSSSDRSIGNADRRELAIPVRFDGANALRQRRMGGHHAEQGFAQALLQEHGSGLAGVDGIDP